MALWYGTEQSYCDEMSRDRIKELAIELSQENDSREVIAIVQELRLLIQQEHDHIIDGIGVLKNSRMHLVGKNTPRRMA